MEKRLLQAIINDESFSYIDQVKKRLNPSDFADPLHEKIFALLVKVSGNGFDSGSLFLTDVITKEFQTQGLGDLVRLGELFEPSTVTEKELHSLVRKIKEARRGFHFMPVSALEVRSPEWIIEGLIENDSLAQFFGDPASYKTFAALDVGACIATGKDFHGRTVRQNGATLYVAGEGRGGLSRRVLAWEIVHDTSLRDAPFFISSGPASLCDLKASQQLDAAIEQVAQAHEISLIVIDTLARSFGGGDENSTKDMNFVITVLDRIRIKHHCTILLIHHTGHTDKSRARGAMALKGALDCEYRFEKDEDDIVRMEATKMKDAVLPEPMAFTLATVELGTYDDDGNMMTSAILRATDYEARTRGAKAGTGKNQSIALEALKDLYERNRDRLEERGYNPEAAKVTIDDWRKACFDEGIKRSGFYACQKSLMAIRKIKVSGKYVYLV